MKTLNPCPFCASVKAEVWGEPPKRAMTRQFERDWGGYWVRCDQCDCTLGLLDEEQELDLTKGKFATEAEAIAAWNHRPTAPADQKIEFSGPIL